jgi:hypothetical protein
MNERIYKLIEECTDRHFSDCVGGFETFDKEKFAELIVRECAKIAEKEQKFSNQYSLYNIDRCILVEFGL